MYYQNVNGLRTKLHLLRESINSSTYDIVIFTETNLTPDILTSELGFINFNVFRRDRSSANSNKESGGGVLVALNCDFPSSELSSSIDNVECLFVSARILDQEIIVGGVYIPPQSRSQVYSSLGESLEEVSSLCEPNTKMIIAGDFNLPGVDWTNPSSVPANLATECIFDMMNFFNLRQQNNILNSRGVLLDLVFAMEGTLEVVAALDPLIALEDFHPALEFSLVFDCMGAGVEDIYIPDLRRCCTEEVRRWIESLPYPDTNDPDIEASFSQFCLNLGNCIRSNSPMKKICKSNFPRWFTPELKNLIGQKKNLHHIYKSTLSERDYAAFSTVRQQCKELTKSCYSNYTHIVNENIKSNPKAFWGHMKTICKVNTVPGKLVFNSTVAVNPQEMCELFASYFSSVYAQHVRNPPLYSYDSCSSVTSWYISAVEVEKKLKNLDGSKGAGPDCITPAVVKSCSATLAPHLSIYFNVLLKKGIFPQILKHGYLVPIHKSGQTSCTGNYRPIVIQSVVAKIFEGLILDGLSFSFKNIIIPEQHGFRPGKSTITNLSAFTNYVTSAFSRSNQVDCLYLDFSKAFDKVSHAHLVEKLKALGIEGPLLLWFESYLAGRSLQVKFASSLSRTLVNVTSGVPQGSLLGPFLFCLFINDIGKSLACSYLIFADDVKMYVEVSSGVQQLCLQQDLEKIVEWCSENAMQLNESKCRVMIFSRSKKLLTYTYRIGDSILERVTTIKDLGLHMSPNLTPDVHIAKISSRANSVLGLIARTSRNTFSPDALKTLYVALVRPILEYGSVVWSPHQIGHSNSLDLVQKRFLRLLGVRSGARYIEVDTQRIAKQYQLLPLSSRRAAFDLLFLFKIVNGLIDSPELLMLIDFHVPTGTRLVQTFAKHHHLTAYEYHSLVPRLLRLGNEAQLEFFGTSALQFRRKVFSWVADLT